MSTTTATQTQTTLSPSESSLHPIAHSPVHERKAPDYVPSPGTVPASVNRPNILQRLPKKERDLLEGVINRFRALDFNFDVKPFRNIRNADQNVSVELQNGSVEIEASTSTNNGATLDSTEPPSYVADSTQRLASGTLPEDPDADNHTSPAYLARRIQMLLDSMPPPNNDSDFPEDPLSIHSPLLTSIATPPNSPLFTTVPTPPSPISPRRQARLIPRSLPHSRSPPPSHLDNTELMEMLSSATVMNGSSSRGKRTSVWSVLDDIRAPRGWPRSRKRTSSIVQGVVEDAGATPGNIGGLGQVVEGEDEGDAFSDESSVMMYSPLMPTTSSLVELAETEFMPMSMSIGDEDQTSQPVVSGSRSEVYDAGSGDLERARSAVTEEDTQTPTRRQTYTSVPAPGPSSSPSSVPHESGPVGSWMRVWPFNSWGSKVDVQDVAPAIDSETTPKTEQKAIPDSSPDVQPIAGPSSLPISMITSSDPMGIDRLQGEGRLRTLDRPSAIPPAVDPTNTRRPTFRVQGQRRWVPSTTQLSFETRWWGYRIYLPPPVLAVLSDRQLEATKRAALITTALTWFFSNIPVNVLPPAVRPGVNLLKTLVPCVGYIGTFISWSWATMMGYDEGYGIILTATWLLPVALIPGTWNQRDFPPASPGPHVPQTLPFVIPRMETSPGRRDSVVVTSNSGDSSTTPVSTVLSSPEPSLSSPLPPLPPPIESTSPRSPNAEHFQPPSSNLPRPSPLPAPYLSSPHPSPTRVISPSSEPLPPSAPNQHTIPLPGSHSPVLYESRFRALPDIPSDEEPYLQRFDLEATVLFPPPAPSPRTIPLPDIENRHQSMMVRSAKGKRRGGEVDEHEREPGRNLWGLSSKRGPGSGKVRMKGKGVTRN